MKNALTTPPSPSKEKTTWGAVCQQVGLADNLYRTCREKLGNEFSPSSPFGGTGGLDGYDEDFEDFDIGREVRKSALLPPPPPGKDWKPEEENGLMQQLMDGSLSKKIMIYGGGALALWFLYDKYLGDKKTASVPTPPALSSAIATALHVPAARVSDTAPTTVDIPSSLRG